MPRADLVWTFPVAAGTSPYSSGVDLGHTDIVELTIPQMEAGTTALVLQVSRDAGATYATVKRTVLDGVGYPVALPASDAAATVVRFHPGQLLSLGLCRWMAVLSVASLTPVNQDGQVVTPQLRDFQ